MAKKGINRSGIPKSTYYVILALILLLGFLLSIYPPYTAGYNGLDGFYYAYLAHSVQLHGLGSLPPSAFSVKFLLLLGMSAAYRLFGVSIPSSALYGLLSFLGLILVTNYLGKAMYNEKLGLISAFLVSIIPLALIESTGVGDDITTALFTALSILFLVSGLKTYKNYWFFASGFTSIIGLISGGLDSLLIFVFIIPLLVYYIIKKKRKILSNSFIFAAGVFTALLVIAALSFLLLNSPFAYFQETFRQTVLDYSQGARPISNLIDYTTLLFPNFKAVLYPHALYNYVIFKRLEYFIFAPVYIGSGPFYFGINYFGYFGVLLLLGVLFLIITRERRLNIALLWLLIVFLYLSVGTVTLLTYAPIVFGPRFATLLIVPLSIIAAFSIEKMIDTLRNSHARHSHRVLAILSIVFIISVIFVNSFLIVAYSRQQLNTNVFQEIQTANFISTLPSNSTLYIISGFSGSQKLNGSFGSPFDLNSLESVKLGIYTKYAYAFNVSFIQSPACDRLKAGSYIIIDYSIHSTATTSPYALLSSCKGLHYAFSPVAPLPTLLPIFPLQTDHYLSVYRYE